MSENWDHLIWRRGSRCGSANCVEVAGTARSIFVRDSKDPDGPPLEFSREAWGTFITAIERGQFAVPSGAM